EYCQAVRFPATPNFQHRADARRAAPLAAAVGDQIDRGLDEFVVEAEQPLGQAHAAWRAFVQVDRGAAGVRRADLVDAAQVVRVAHQVEWGDVMERMGEGGEGALEAVTRRERVADNYGWEDPPGAGRVHRRLGQGDRAPADVLLREEFQFLEDRRPVGDDYVTVCAGEGTACCGIFAEDVDADGDLRIGIVVDLD